MKNDDIAGRVHKAIGRIPRRGGRDPETLPPYLLDLPEERAPARMPLCTLLLLAALLAMYAANLPRRAEPPPAHATPTIEGVE